MGNISEAVTVLFAAMVVTATAYEINRRRKKLREIYDVLDGDTRHVAAQLEDLIAQGKLTPYTGETWG